MTSMTRKPRRSRPRVENLEGRALMAAGALDTTFGGTGTVITQASHATSNAASRPYGLAIQSDLKTVVVGQELPNGLYSPPFDTAVVRYNVDGSLDTSFGSGGEAIVPTHSTHIGLNTRATSVAIQPDGKILVATNNVSSTTTTVKHVTTTVNKANMLVVRLNADGSLDSSFGTSGQAAILLPGGSDITAGLILLPGGQIVVAGTSVSGITGPDFVVARLTSSGALDTSFGPNHQGYNALPTSGTGAVTSAAMDASGNIVLGGTGKDPNTNVVGAMMVRYTPSGLLDATFASQGIFDLPGGYGFVGSLAALPNGQMLLSGYPNASYGNQTIARMNVDGSIDATFGTNGTFTDSTAYMILGMAIQPNGSALIEGIGVDSSGNPSGLKVDRILPNGTLDTTFGVGGQELVTFAKSAGRAEGLAVGPDGKITGIGIVTNAFGVFRLLPDSTYHALSLNAGSGRAHKHPRNVHRRHG